MSIHIHLIDPPDYYTNLDIIKGEVRFFLAKAENVGAIVVKLEGESDTSLTVPKVENEEGWSYKDETLHDLDPSRSSGTVPRPSPGTEAQEKHKVLYQVSQVYPPRTDDPKADSKATNELPPGQHSFPFHFRLPFNNTCADPAALARSGGLVDPDGNIESLNGGPGRFGRSASGIRVMNGSKQLLLRHVKQTLPPTFTGYLDPPNKAKIRYFIKVTVQRPGIFKENWRNDVDFKFLPIEPLRPAPSTRQVFARRPFTFQERASPSQSPSLKVPKKKGSFFWNNSSSTLSLAGSQEGPSSSPLSTSPLSSSLGVLQDGLAPSIQIVAYLPFPAILTCNEPIPLRLVAQKLRPSRERVYLTSFEIRLIGKTKLKCQDIQYTKSATWIVMSQLGLSIPVCTADGPVESEIPLPDSLWRHTSLPNTVMPSFVTCNVSREYQLEVRLGLSWGLPPLGMTMMVSSGANGKQTKREKKAALKALKAQDPHFVPETINLPLNFEAVQVYSGITPSQTLVEAVAIHRQHQLQQQQHGQQEHRQEKHEVRSHQQEQPPQRHLQQQQGQRIQKEKRQADGEHQRQRLGRQQPGQQQPIFPLQHRQRSPQQQEESAYELSAEPPPPQELSGESPPPVIPPRPDGSIYKAPPSPSSPFVAPPSVPSAVEVPATPVIRRRPVPPRVATQQQQRHQQNQEKSMPAQPLSARPAKGPQSPIGRVNGSVHHQAPRQQYHLHQQQTAADPLYMPQMQLGEQASSSSLGTATQQGTVLVSYNGVVSAMAPAVASAIDAFSFADSDTTGLGGYEDPPPSYDEAMADIIEATTGPGNGGGAAQRPAFGAETDVPVV